MTEGGREDSEGATATVTLGGCTSSSTSSTQAEEAEGSITINWQLLLSIRLRESSSRFRASGLVMFTPDPPSIHPSIYRVPDYPSISGARLRRAAHRGARRIQESQNTDSDSRRYGPRSHRTQSTSQQANANYKTHFGQWECSHRLQATSKGLHTNLLARPV